MSTETGALPRGKRGAARATGAIVAGVLAWFVVATLGNVVLRALIPGYRAAEAAMSFTLTMQIGRLLLGLVSSIGAGWICGAIARSGPTPVRIAALLLLALFVPVHYALWAKFPLWYHAFFLLTLVPAVLLGGILSRSRTRID